MRGIRTLSVARQELQQGEGGTSSPTGPWRMLGLLTFLDPPRPDTRRTIERALEWGVDVKMVTGDHVSRSLKPACSQRSPSFHAAVQSTCDACSKQLWRRCSTLGATWVLHCFAPCTS
jgi:hypothetical protein